MKMQNHFDPVTFGSKAIPTLVRLLRQRADEHPAQPAYTFLSGDDLTNRDSLTYEELDRRARQIALLLHEIGRGERVLLCLPPGLDYVAAYFGCLYAGVIAVPVYPIDPADQTRNDRMLSRLRAILHDSQATALLTTSALLPAQQELMTQSTKPLSLIPVDTAYDLPADTWRAPNVRGDNVAMLMYTSGSTGSPRGVVVSHANLMHNLSAFPGFTARPCTTVVSWLPLFHDLGLLLGVLHPLYRRARAVLFAPTDFVQKPLRWLKTMSQEHASTTGAPNFAYELCIRRTTEEQRAGLDLSAWTMALNGAEPVRQDTIDRFTKVFEPYGFRRETCYPSYGLAEATATVSGGGAVSEPLVLQLQSDALTQHTITIAQDEVARSYVGCGEGIADQTIAIVDPENQTRCQAGRVGEIWLASPSVARGYWNRPEETKATFQAYLADTGAGPFLRTGDLGFVQDGQLFITGRLKDVIIVHGSNHYPQDIEHTVERSHAALRPGGSAAFALDEDGEERLIVVCEVASRSDTETHTIFDNIRQSITEQHDIDTHTIALIPPGNLPKTSSGKVQRRACRERYLAQTLEIVACWQKEGLVSAQSIPSSNGVSPAITRTDVQGWLVQHLASRLGIAPDTLDIHQPFARYGLASVEAVGLAGELADWLERPISPTVVWEHPTIERLAQYITVSTVQARENGRTTPLAEPIAIVGMSCRLPGVNDLNDYWELLYNGIDAVGEVPPERWDVNSFYAADRNAPGKTTTRWGGFLERLEEFDARFFSVSPREAAHLDPRQRVLMELSYEALELAGISFEQLAGSATGVFMAALSNDYDQLLFRDLTRVDAYSGSGTANSILANRLSYFFDLRGPSVTLDTACSGSLVAIHLACQSIQNGESTLALAGGISINLLPNGNIFFSKAGALAADGRCKTFDAGADGIVRSEGAGVIVLKSLAQALADKDPIYAVIRGSAVNSDGRSNGIMAPNGKAQEAVLWDAYRRADIDPGRVQYIEAHGTGTSVGDPIELQALGTVLSHGRTPGSVCHVSSVKTNIGHTEAAAGVAGLIKVALALKHGFIPPTIHYQSPNPLIPFDKIPLTVADTPVPWQANGESRIAGVSSFGFGGTNAHVVLEGMPRMGNEAPTAEQSRYLLPISAQSEEALRDLADAYRAYLESGVSLPDLCYTASIRRPHYEQRLALVGETNEELAEHLAAFVRGEPRAEYSHGRHVPNQKQRIVFVFSGQGSHWVSMGRELFDAEPVFRSTIERCDKLLQQFVDWSLIAQITAPDNERLNETSIAQPAIFAVQVALAELWRTWGITPDVVVGQSLGEVAAAYCAGALSLDDA
ncbi:MAG: beta-ketoacyl synthase N-terminal-like domain-containing protein, partial [Chloroflexota bacterium]